MAKVYDAISDNHRAFIEHQHLFFVGSAPLDASGHVNLSPKGGDCFRVLSPNHVMYLDLTGSGNETSAHVLENGRITLMFCAFDGSPLILRLYGTGRTVRPGDADWDELIAHFPAYPGPRQIIAAEIDRVQTSCGYGVPLYEYQGERDQYDKWCAAKGESLPAYQRENNSASIDGLPTPIGLEQQA